MTPCLSPLLGFAIFKSAKSVQLVLLPQFSLRSQLIQLSQFLKVILGIYFSVLFHFLLKPSTFSIKYRVH